MSVENTEQSQTGGTDRGLDLSSLFQGFLGEGAGSGSGSTDLGGLGGVLGALLGQGAPASASPADPVSAGIVEGAGVSPAVGQAALSLVLGSLLRGGVSGGSGIAALMNQAADQPLDEEAVKATGLPAQLAKETGINLPVAIRTVQQVLQWLRKVTKPLGSSASGGSTGTAKKRRRKSTSKKETSTARAKPKRPTTSSSAAKAKPKAKPKTTSSATRPKAKPKTTTSSTRPKAKRKTSTRSTPVEPE
jgi:hypothetical protein